MVSTDVIDSFSKRRLSLLQEFDGLRAQIQAWLDAHPDGAAIGEVSQLAGLLEVRREALRRLMENDEALIDYYLGLLREKRD